MRDIPCDTKVFSMANNRPASPADVIQLTEQELYCLDENVKDLIKSYFKGKKTYNINYIEEKKPLGTAGSLKLVQKKIKTDMFIINCDTICKFNFSLGQKSSESMKASNSSYV